MSLIRFARRIWQRHRWSVPLSLVSAMFFARLGWELHENELDVFDAAAQKLVDGWRGSFDQLMVFLTTRESRAHDVVGLGGARLAGCSG